MTLHLARGVATAGLIFPIVDWRTRRALRARWACQLLECLGVELRVHGEADGRMLVINHVSWLDAFVIDSTRPAAFVCKHEVRRWPLIGWLFTRAETIFITRGSARNARLTGQQVSRALASGTTVAVFPEGTTSDGATVLPFSSAMFQPAVDLGVTVQPVMLRYVDALGQRSMAPVYVSATGLLDSILRVAASQRTVAELRFLEPLDPAEGDRRILSAQAESSIREALRRTVVSS